MSAKRVRVPTPPGKLPALAKQRWRFVYPQLAARGAVDLETLHAYVLAWARWRQAEDGIADLGNSGQNPLAGQLTKTPSGRVVPSPLVAIANQAAVTVQQVERRLGIGTLLEPAGDERADAGGDGLLTRQQLAPLIVLPAHPTGVHPQTIVKWEREGLPIAQRGRRGKPSLYRLGDVRAWLQRREAAAAPGTGGTDLIRERATKERWQGQLARQSFLVKQGQLLPVADVERVWDKEIAACRTIILNHYVSAADKVFRAATMEGLAGVERELKALAYAALRELASADRPVDGTTPPDPPKTDEGHAA